MWVLSAVALVIYTDGARSPRDHRITIPAGASELIAAGENPLDIPRTWSFLADDTLRIENRDTTAHRLANWYIPAGETLEVALQPVFTGSFVCSLHPSGGVDFEIEPRRFDWRLPILPAVVLGPAIALVALGTARIMRALDD
jgi:hypothetical protein